MDKNATSAKWQREFAEKYLKESSVKLLRNDKETQFHRAAIITGAWTRNYPAGWDKMRRTCRGMLANWRLSTETSME